MTPPPATLGELQRELDTVSARASRLWTAGPDPCAPPASGGWSVAQCLSHLALSTDAYLPVWRKAFEDSASLVPRPDSGPLRLDLWGRFLYWFLEPPPKIRFQTKSAFTVPSSPTALDDFVASQQELSRFLARSERLAIDRVKIRSAYDSRVRYSIWSSFVTTLAHQRRHVWQAEMTVNRI